MTKRLLLLVCCILITGCSQRAWFVGFVEGQRFQCNQLTGLERENCLDSIMTDYDRYQRERQESR